MSYDKTIYGSHFANDFLLEQKLKETDHGPAAINVRILGLNGDDQIIADDGAYPKFYEATAMVTGQDLFDGGAGTDMVSYAFSKMHVVADLGTGWAERPDNGKVYIGGGNYQTLDRDRLENIEDLFGTTFNDYLYGDENANEIFGYKGNDLIQGRGGNDTLDGGEGDDKIDGGTGNDFIDGGDDNDQIYGSYGLDTLLGGDGDDLIKGGDGNDNISGGEGHDEIHGGNQNDIIDGNKGADTVFGDQGNDIINGGDGNDVIKGGDGEKG